MYRIHDSCQKRVIHLIGGEWLESIEKVYEWVSFSIFPHKFLYIAQQKIFIIWISGNDVSVNFVISNQLCYYFYNIIYW